MKKLFLTLIVTFLIGLLAGCAINTHKINILPHKPKPTLSQKLQLSQEQILKERLIKSETKAKIKPVISELKKKHKEIKQLAKVEPQNSPKLIKKQQEIQDLSMKVKEIHIAHLHKFKKILTPEQESKFNEITKVNTPDANNMTNNITPSTNP